MPPKFTRQPTNEQFVAGSGTNQLSPVAVTYDGTGKDTGLRLSTTGGKEIPLDIQGVQYATDGQSTTVTYPALWIGEVETDVYQYAFLLGGIALAWSDPFEITVFS